MTCLSKRCRNFIVCRYRYADFQLHQCNFQDSRNRSCEPTSSTFLLDRTAEKGQLARVEGDMLEDLSSGDLTLGLTFGEQDGDFSKQELVVRCLKSNTFDFRAAAMLRLRK